MAYNPISQTPIQYSKADGTPASGYYLKFYVANSTTPINMQTDSGGATSLAKCKLNELGFPISNPNDENTVFIPHLLDTYTAYRFVLYASAADADSNTTTNNLPNLQYVKVNQAKAEVDDLRADLAANSGSSLVGFLQAGIGAYAATVQDKLRESVSVKDFGAVGDGLTNDTAAFIAALSAHNVIRVPAGTYLVNGNFNIENKAILGVHPSVSKIKLSGTNTNTPMFVNSGNFGTSWGTGGGFTLEGLEIIGNWDGSTANAVAVSDFANLGSIVRWYAGAKCYVRNCKITNAFGHALSFDRLGYSYIQNNEITACKYDGIHLNGPSGVESVTSTWITSNDIHSCRGTSLIYLKNGLTCIAAFNILEDATHGFYVDGLDNRGVSFVFNDMEQATGAAVNIQGSGTSFCVTNNFLGVTTPIIIANSPEFRSGVFTNNALSSLDYVTFMPKIGSGATYDTPMNFFGAASSGFGTGKIGWISNNNAGATPECELVGVHYGTVNQRGGFFIIRTTDPATGTLSDRIKIDHLGHLFAMVDNTQDLGTASFRWGTVYAGTGSINTSDENEKQDIRDLTEAEKRVATNLKTLIRAYRFKDAVAAKGEQARVHFGLVAQQVAAEFTAERLDPHKYALFCSDTWYTTETGEILSSQQDTEGNQIEGLTPVTRLGLRYDELMAFIISSL